MRIRLQRIYIYGAGGHGKVVADSLRATGLAVAGFLDDSASLIGGLVLDLPVISIGRLRDTCKDSRQIGIALGIGDNRARHAIAERCREWRFELVTAVHPSAVLSPSARVGVGTVVMPRAVINAGAIVGVGVIINTGAVVEHDCVIGDYAHLSPNAALGGGATVGGFSHVGMGAVVLPGISVGARSTIGAAAAVVCNIPDNVTAVGVPARIVATAARSFSLQT